MNTLADLLHAAPAQSTAIILPEAGIRLTYAQLREQVMTMADALAGLGIGRGDRVATVLPNGLPAIVSFLAASIAGTAAPLNPGYREDEFAFFLEDTSAKILLCPADGAADARKAAEGKVPVYSLEMDARRLRHASPERPKERPPPRRRPTTSRSSCTPAAAPGGPSACRSGIATWPPRRTTSSITTLSPDDVSLCVMPLFHVHGLVASTLSTLLSGGTVVVPDEVQSALVLAHRARLRRHLVFRGADHSSICCSRAPATNARRAPRGCASSAPAARRCRRK